MSLVQLHLDRTAFSPGETATGTASWQVAAPPDAAALQLIWSTRGKGTTDIEVVQTIAFSHPQARETQPFTIKLPNAPYTFSGQLISLIWNLELNVGAHSEVVEITVAPEGKEVLLPNIQSAK